MADDRGLEDADEGALILRIKTHLRKGLEAYQAVGEDLIRAKQLYGQHGQWEAWVKRNLPISLTRVKQCIRLALEMKSAVTADLTQEEKELRWQQIQGNSPKLPPLRRTFAEDREPRQVVPMTLSPPAAGPDQVPAEEPRLTAAPMITIYTPPLVVPVAHQPAVVVTPPVDAEEQLAEPVHATLDKARVVLTTGLFPWERVRLTKEIGDLYDRVMATEQRKQA